MALPGMVRGRALRCDGLSMEFYFKFWLVLGDDLVLALNSAFRSGSLSRSQRRGIITLAFKNGDRRDPKKLATNHFVKCRLYIASRSIAARLFKVVHLIVNKDQTRGVPGRFIGENVALLRDVFYFCTSAGVPAALLS